MRVLSLVMRLVTTARSLSSVHILKLQGWFRIMAVVGFDLLRVEAL